MATISPLSPPLLLPSKRKRKPKTPSSPSSSPSLLSTRQLHARALRLCTTQSFNHAIRSYTSISLHNHSLNLFLSMLHSNLTPNQFTFPFVLKSCVGLNGLSLGLQIHASVVKLGCFECNDYCACAVLDLYVKLVGLEDALQVFERMKQIDGDGAAWNLMIMALVQNGFFEKGFELMEEMEDQGLKPGIRTWNSILAGCVKSRKIELAFHILREMVSKSHLKPNTATLNTIISIISSIPSSNIIKELHGFILKNSQIIGLGPINSDRIISTLASAYSRTKLIDYAYKLFHQVRLKIEILYICMIEGFLDSGQVDKSFEVFREMAFQFGYDARSMAKFPLTLILPKCEPTSKNGLEIHAYAYRNNLEFDTSVCNALMAMYSKRGNIDYANKIFRRAFEKDVVSFNTMISNLISIGDSDVAFELFNEMLAHEIKPDEYTFCSLIHGCGFCSYLKQGTAFHAQIFKLGFYDSDLAVENALMNCYGNCGCIQDAHKVFDEMKHKDIISWNTLISSYGFSPNPKKSLALFQTMQERGFKPNQITFTALLSACSHAGLGQEALSLFETMSKNYDITPNLGHYCCIVDCLSRVGQLKKALDLINSMPLKPDDCIWGALLNGCRIHNEVELAEFVTKKLLDLDPNHSGYWILMSNTYAEASRWSDVRQVREKMNRMGVRKNPGFSWVESEMGGLDRFYNGDKLHERSDEIYLMLDGLIDQLKDEGYVPLYELNNI
ncbi:hypothetical protein LUZ60_008760 [Juncus effusus]|nr:hypothetical protein LUZ60_008760 [Juncus effusus]